MNKKMFIICLLFVLISSCKTDESKEEKSLDNILDDIGLEVEKLVQADEAPKKAGNKDGGGGAVAGAAAVGGAGGAVVAAGGVPGAGAGGGAVAGAGDNIKKQIAELKNKINSADSKKISLQKYREYEEEVKKLREKIKELNNGNNGNDAELNQLEGSLKTKKDARKKELEESKKKLEGFKTQVGAATGQTYGDQARNKGKIGQQASQYAKALGLNVNTAKYSNDTSKLVSHIIEEAIKKIEEELKKE